VSDFVASEIVDGIAIVRIDRPAVLNALDRAMVRALVETFGTLAEDASVRAVVLIGEHGAFSTGDDLAEAITATPDEFSATVAGLQELTRRIVRMPQPVIAAIDRYAFGGGLEIAASCDLRIATEGARFGCPEVTLGLLMTNASTSLLPRLVGHGRAREIALTGETFDAARAYEMGFVNRIVPRGALLAEAVRIAQRIAAAGPVAVRLTKALLDAPVAEEIEAALHREAAAVMQAFGTEDAREGLCAFRERRAPEFRGA
jgi:enoyl-CoA hydratase